jgi:hypothetical protein
MNSNVHKDPYYAEKNVSALLRIIPLAYLVISVQRDSPSIFFTSSSTGP